MISCYCAVYGRVHLLREAVESFLRQDYAGEKELVILNDHADQQLVCDVPGVTVLNIGRRFHSLGEKWNALISLCKGDVFTPWDDDDLHMPWFLRVSMEYLRGHEYFRPLGAIFWQRAQLPRFAFNAPYHSQCLFTRKCFDLVQGYPLGRRVPEDTTFETLRTLRGIPSLYSLIPLVDYGYIYRWKWAWNNSDGWTGQPAAGDAQAPAGRIVIEPGWDSDYIQAVLALQDRKECIDPHGLLNDPKNREILLAEGLSHYRGQQPAEPAGGNNRLAPAIAG